jgi:hypothetical protein
MGEDVAACCGQQGGGGVGIDALRQRGGIRRAMGKLLDDRAFARAAMRDQPFDTRRRVGDRRAVAGQKPRRRGGGEACAGGEELCQIAIGRRDECAVICQPSPVTVSPSARW